MCLYTVASVVYENCLPDPPHLVKCVVFQRGPVQRLSDVHGPCSDVVAAVVVVHVKLIRPKDAKQNAKYDFIWRL
ncbi:hypothetical protein TgHK011_004563 [Trichoderma gracile]|nr:hypothetical protein TgHK011_004563 [Trichoderma gracile]